MLTSLRNWDKFFQPPFKTDVYFFSTRDQIDQRWGMPQPITLRDRGYGALQSLPLPGEVQERMDRVSSMRIVGETGQYTKFEGAASPSALARQRRRA